MKRSRQEASQIQKHPLCICGRLGQFVIDGQLVGDTGRGWLVYHCSPGTVDHV